MHACPMKENKLNLTPFLCFKSLWDFTFHHNVPKWCLPQIVCLFIWRVVVAWCLTFDLPWLDLSLFLAPVTCTKTTGRQSLVACGPNSLFCVSFWVHYLQFFFPPWFACASFLATYIFFYSLIIHASTRFEVPNSRKG